MGYFWLEAKIVTEDKVFPVSVVEFNVVKEPFRKTSTFYTITFSLNYVDSVLIQNEYFSKFSFNYEKNYLELSIYEFERRESDFSDKKNLKLIFKDKFVLKNLKSLGVIKDVKNVVFFKSILVPVDVYKLIGVKSSNKVFIRIKSFREIFEEIFETNFSSVCSCFVQGAPVHEKIPKKYLVERMVLPNYIELLDSMNFMVQKYKTHVYPTFFFLDSFDFRDCSSYEIFEDFQDVKSFRKIKEISYLPDKARALKLNVGKNVFSISDTKVISKPITEVQQQIFNAGKVILRDEFGHTQVLDLNPDSKSVVNLEISDDFDNAKERILKNKELWESKIRNFYSVKIEHSDFRIFDVGYLYSVDGGNKFDKQFVFNRISFKPSERAEDGFKTVQELVMVDYTEV